MKRKALSLALALLLCLSLSAAVFAARDVSGHYDATACEKDGNQYSYDDEYLELNADGTGVVTFGGTLYKITWTLSGSDFHFEDEDGYEMDGTYRSGVISGNYAGYDFTYELKTSATPTPAPTSTPTPSAAPAPKADLSPYAGTYKAVSCVRDGESYVCDQDALELRADGTGTITFNGDVYAMEWTLDGESFSMVDEDGDIMEGRLSDGRLVATYARYTYEFERSAGSAPIQTWVDDGVIPGTYYPESCIYNGQSCDVSREYLVLNEDGSAMLVYDGCAFPASWELSGESFTLRDVRPVGSSVMTGTLSGGTLTSEYRSCQYVYHKKTDAPIMFLAPERWNSGLPWVTDQAGLLSANEISRLSAEAESLAAKYNCGVYIVTLDDMGKFSPSNNVETCAEEIRVGYDLGLGSKHDCILLLMSMADRSYDLCVYGDFATEAFNDYARSTIEKAMLDDFRGNDWAGGYSDYQAQCAKLLEAAAAGKPISSTNNPARRVGSVLASILLGFLVAIIFCSVKKGKMRSVKQQQRAMDYIPDSGVNIAFRYDQFTHSTQTRVYDPPASKSSGGGGGGGSSSSGHSHSSGHF